MIAVARRVVLLLSSNSSRALYDFDRHQRARPCSSNLFRTNFKAANSAALSLQRPLFPQKRTFGFAILRAATGGFRRELLDLTGFPPYDGQTAVIKKRHGGSAMTAHHLFERPKRTKIHEINETVTKSPSSGFELSCMFILLAPRERYYLGVVIEFDSDQKPDHA